MKLQSLFLRTSLLVFLTLLSLGAPHVAAQSNAQPASQSPLVQTSAVPARITQAIDETHLVRLKGNVHPLARPEFDQGAVPDSMLATRMLLLLQRSSEQEAGLGKLLDDQQNKGSAVFHKWLTPQQFGAQFGPADADVQTLTDWLARHGFQGIKVAAGRTVIEFSGTVGQVRNAFHTEIHRYLVNGEIRQANASDPQIPVALAPVVAGIAGLHNFPPRAYVHRLGTFRRDKATGTVKPLFTFTGGICGANNTCFTLGPTDFATIYNVAPLWTAGIDGTGEAIALVGDSNINIQDVRDFRSMFGLPAKDPQVIVNGPDPGLNGDEIEADLDTQWAGSVAKNAQIILVVTEQPLTIGVAGVDLSALYIIDNNLAPVMSESFGICEASTFANNQLEKALWQQASSQGITAMVSAGDNGSAGCDPTNVQPLVATQGLGVSGVASTPFNVAVGGTDFNSSLANYFSTYWNTSNSATFEASAKSYIPEITWNDTCASGGVTTACSATVINNDATNIFPGIDVVAGSGGSSAIYTGSSNKPSWQTGLGDANRDIPDVSLFSGNGRHGTFYIICEQDANAADGGSPTSCDLNSPFVDFQGVGGTSASSPTFAGIMALVNQKTGQRQGNANYVLYPMSKKSGATCPSNATTAANPGSCIFYDLPAGSGNISVACQGGTPQCSNASTSANQFGIMTTTTGGTTPAYNTGAGYDLATGLGSVNAANLVNNWTNPTFTPSKTTFTLNGGSAVNITHGASVTVSGTVSPNPGSGTPTGLVELVQGTSGQTGVVLDTFNLSSGSYSGSTRLLPGTNGTSYQVIAHYGGDGTFAASDSPAQTVTSVAKENSSVTMSFVTSNGVITTAAQTVAYGSPYILRVDVTNAALQPCSSTVGIPCPTGTVTEFDNGQPLNDFLVPNTSTPTNSTTLTNQGFIEDQPVQLNGGSHSITASYGGDASFNAQPSSNTLSVTITNAATTASLGASPNPVPVNQQVTLSVTINSQSNSTQGPTGTVTFKDGSTSIGTASVTPASATATAGASGTASLSMMFATTGAHSLTAVYGGDPNYATSTSSATTLTVGTTTTTTLMASPTSLPAGGGSVTLTATVTGTGTGASPTGTVQFMFAEGTPTGGTALGTPQTCTAVSGASPPACKATLTTTVAFLAPPPIGPQRIPTLQVPWILLVGFALVLLLLLNLKRVPARYRRVYAGAALLLLAALVAGGLTSCSGGYGGGGGGGGVHYDYVSAVYSGDTTYAGSTSAAVTITVQ